MNNLEIQLTNKNGVIVERSTELAKKFEKRHDNIIAKIDSKIVEWNKNTSLKNKVSEYFMDTSYKDESGKTNREYLLTRDGFSYLAMGFTGSKADLWKVKYIDAFNKMELHIKNNIYQIDRKDNLILSLVKSGCEPIQLAEYTKMVEDEGVKKGMNGENRLMSLGQVVDVLNTEHLDTDRLTTMILNEFMAETLNWGEFKKPLLNKRRREFIPNKKFIDLLVKEGGSYTGKTKKDKVKIQYSVDMINHILKYKSQLEQFINDRI